MSDDEKITKSFVKLKCVDCGNEQITFSKASSVVNCEVCGTILAEPTGGIAEFKGEIIEEVE